MTNKDEKQKVMLGLAMAQVIGLMKDINEFMDDHKYNIHYEIYNHLKDYYKGFVFNMRLLGYDIPEINHNMRKKVIKHKMKKDFHEIMDMLFDNDSCKDCDDVDCKLRDKQ